MPDAPATTEAIILAGGLGTRLRSVVKDVPKPLAQVAGRPFLAWLLDELACRGIRRLIFAVGYRGDQIFQTFGTQWGGMTLAYSRETEPLGTGGAIMLAAAQLEGDSCFVLNGDTWLRLDYKVFDHYVRGTGARLGVAVAQVPDVSRYGAVQIRHGCVAGVVEKGQSGPGWINAGLYWLDRALLPEFPGSGHFSFETGVLVPLSARERVAAFAQTSDFIDIGVPEDYSRSQHLFAIRGKT